MRYRVYISEKAEADIAGVLAWFQSRLAGEAAAKWLGAIWKAIDTLETTPDRCPTIAESEALGFDIRELLFGRRIGRYRILFQIRGNTVHILRVWHSARDKIRPEEL
ncbi:MAG: Death on curing protein Doc toxin [Planctomycetaceae bacterium]|nr:Death on curing protein Doc toxin [Planctomycetaceae bacterium]